MNKLLMNWIRRYQESISPKLQVRGVRCLFEPSCSQYAVISLENHNVIKAIPLIVWRLLQCNPINARRKIKINTNG